MLLVSNTPGQDGGALGIVSLEDVIEEMIGEEIVDETDVYIDVHQKIKVIRRPALKASGKAGLGPLLQGIIERRRGIVGVGADGAAAGGKMLRRNTVERDYGAIQSPMSPIPGIQGEGQTTRALSKVRVKDKDPNELAQHVHTENEQNGGAGDKTKSPLSKSPADLHLAEEDHAGEATPLLRDAPKR